MTESGTWDRNQTPFLFFDNILFDTNLFSSILSIFNRCQSSYNPDIRVLLLSTPFLYCSYMKGGEHMVTQDDDCLINYVRKLFI